MLGELIHKCRSFRRFYQEVAISRDELLEMVDNARLSASARNSQSLKYFLANQPNTNALIFECLSWAGYLKDWAGPDEGERPSAYIVIVNDGAISTHYFCDHGIATQSILLTAVEKDLGGCIIASINREKLRANLSISEHYEIVHVIALGKPKETVVIDPLPDNGSIQYWRDENQVHHVPKRKLEDIIFGE